MLTTTDIAWIAGLFEGEGCIHIPSQRHGVSVRLKMADRDVVEALHALFPCPKIRVVKPHQPHHKYQYEWCLTNGERIVRFLEIVLPFLKERRSKKAHELIAYIANRPGKGTFNANKIECPKGHQYAPENVYFPPSGINKGKRVCRTCRDEYKKAWREKQKTTSGQVISA